MTQLRIEEDETFVPSNNENESTSSSAEDGKHNQKLIKLNEFLEECGVERLTQKPWVDWATASDKTRNRYVERASEVVATVLSVTYPDNVEELWRALKTSSVMSRLLGSEPSAKSNSYIQAMAEAYKNASSWDTRRQILSIMTGIASFKEIQHYIPGLTYYRYTIANLHRVQYGCGTPVTVQYVPRLRIDRKQLDHFLSYITSPHIVQDLPFGEKNLKLSSGQLIAVPNVIRAMIPQRIVKQYKQYCLETNFVPFSESTMLRILSECKASVRKSLQGLDYFAAEGSRAFEDLNEILERTLQHGDHQDIVTNLQESLKAGKLYLKGDYKVNKTKRYPVG